MAEKFINVNIIEKNSRNHSPEKGNSLTLTSTMPFRNPLDSSMEHDHEEHDEIIEDFQNYENFRQYESAENFENFENLESLKDGQKQTQFTSYDLRRSENGSKNHQSGIEASGSTELAEKNSIFSKPTKFKRTMEASEEYVSSMPSEMAPMDKFVPKMKHFYDRSAMIKNYNL